MAAKEGLQEKLSAVLPEQQAQEQASYWTGMAIKDFQVTKDNGGWDGNFEDFANQFYALNRLRIMENGLPRFARNDEEMTADEVEEMWNERLAEVSKTMSDEERDFFESRPSRKLYSLADNETDFIEYKGKPEEAIDKLLSEKRGYVSGAIYKEGVGDIDFIYGKDGDKGYGLAHIIEQREKQGIDGVEFVKSIPAIIRDGSVYKRINQDGRVFIISKDKEALIRLDWNGEGRNWLLTAYMKKSRALPALQTSSEQTYLDEPITSSNSAFDENITLENENVKGDNKLYSKEDKIADINTPEFKKWFGDSKVVDEKGKPLVVYHGTSTKFDVFKNRYNFFSDNEKAAGGYGTEKPMPVYLSMKNPLIIDAYGQSFGEIYNAEGRKKAYKDLTEEDYKKIAKSYELSVEEAKEFFPKNEDGEINLAKAYGEKARSTNEWAEYAKKNGYDGVIIKDVNDTVDLSTTRSTDYVVFNSNQIKSVYNRGTFDKEDHNILHSEAYDSRADGEVFGSYDPVARMVELMTGHNPSTLTHELSHHFFMSHIKLMEEMGLNDRNKPVFDWLSKKGGHEINSIRDMKRADWENMSEAFIEYMNTNEAPNLVTKNIFQRAKEWLLDNYRIHRTEASPEIRDYFDSLITRDTAMPDVSALANQIGQVSEVLRQAQKGELMLLKMYLMNMPVLPMKCPADLILE